MLTVHGYVQAQAASQAELKAVQAELQGATEMLDTLQQMASSSMEGQEEAQKQMDALTSQLQAAIQVCPPSVRKNHSGVAGCFVCIEVHHLDGTIELRYLQRACNLDVIAWTLQVTG